MINYIEDISKNNYLETANLDGVIKLVRESDSYENWKILLDIEDSKRINENRSKKLKNILDDGSI